MKGAYLIAKQHSKILESIYEIEEIEKYLKVIGNKDVYLKNALNKLKETLNNK